MIGCGADRGSAEEVFAQDEQLRAAHTPVTCEDLYQYQYQALLQLLDRGAVDSNTGSQGFSLSPKSRQFV